MPIDIGAGPAVVLLAGFGLPPAIYRHTAELLAPKARVIVPELYRIRCAWELDDVVRLLRQTFDVRGVEHVTLIGHSFAGSVELRYATRHPDQVTELVFADTLAVSREWPLAQEAASHPLRLFWLATPSVAAAFGRTAMTHPRQIAQAAWFGFRSGRTRDTRRVAELGLRSHVMWASRDSLLSRADGRTFAREMHASFTVVDGDGHAPIDHDWMYRHPRLFVEHLERLGLTALTR